MKTSILALIAVFLTAGGMWGVAQQPSVQSALVYPWIGCPGRHVSRVDYNPTTPTWYHACHGPLYHYNR